MAPKTLKSRSIHAFIHPDLQGQSCSFIRRMITSWAPAWPNSHYSLLCSITPLAVHHIFIHRVKGLLQQCTQTWMKQKHTKIQWHINRGWDCSPIFTAQLESQNDYDGREETAATEMSKHTNTDSAASLLFWRLKGRCKQRKRKMQEVLPFFLITHCWNSLAFNLQFHYLLLHPSSLCPFNQSFPPVESLHLQMTKHLEKTHPESILRSTSHKPPKTPLLPLPLYILTHILL